MKRRQKKTEKEERFYPSECLSAFCGSGGGDACNACKNKPALDEFNKWVIEHKAIQPDSIWARTLYQATI